MEQTKPMEYREYAEYTESRPDGQPEPCPPEEVLVNRAEGKQGMQRENQKKRKSRIRIVSRVNRSPREGVST